MSRHVDTSSTDQSIRVWAYDSDGVAITGQAYNSAGIAVSVVVRSAGRIISTTSLTLVARSSVGVHRDSAFTEVAGGEYVVDLPDSYFTTSRHQVSVTLTSTAIAGGYVVTETLDVRDSSALTPEQSAAIIRIDSKTALITAGRIRVQSRVTGAVITAKAGDDHLVAAENALTLEIDDDDCAIYQFLRDATHTALEFGAGRDTLRDEITADIDSSEVTHVGTQTYVPIELTAADTVNLRAGEYSFDIQATTAAGYKVTKAALEGTLVLTADRKS